jgi:hypothetical protein
LARELIEHPFITNSYNELDLKVIDSTPKLYRKIKRNLSNNDKRKINTERVGSPKRVKRLNKRGNTSKNRQEATDD